MALAHAERCEDAAPQAPRYATLCAGEAGGAEEMHQRRRRRNNGRVSTGTQGGAGAARWSQPASAAVPCLRDGTNLAASCRSRGTSKLHGHGRFQRAEDR